MQASEKIAVAGATGRVGRHVVDVLTDAGHDVVAMARSNGVDVVSGEGLAKTLAGVECVIDVASGPSRSRRGGPTGAAGAGDHAHRRARTCSMTQAPVRLRTCA